ncbi:MAG: alpha/beta fold hydrolase [Alphaproteobacteria bacterium]|nr:alpha/beta fold hydrolase [Alphaproteobacteria bacterium]MBL6938887.1 alpha/beta fold hydrolase [Alphaproteobacteria bacterium]MBL7099479.1 alpha/beta fold hydrolase [Alphaproteobacteria bacterium]
MIRFIDIAIGAILAASITIGSARAAEDPNRLYSDSTLVTRDRFSDEIVGTGPDLVLIPGLASSRLTWRATAERLKAHYRLHLIQIAGFAGEPVRTNAAGDVLIPTAEAVDAYLVEQHLTPATVIGHSLGGTTTLYLAAHHGDHLKKVLLVDALPYFGVVMAGPAATPETLKPMADVIRASTQPAPGIDKMIASMVTSDADRTMVRGWGSLSDRSVVNRATADDLQLDLRSDLAKIGVPVTLLYPDNIPNGAPAAAMDGFYRSAYAPVPHKTLTRIDNSRHFIMLDQPAAFDAALDAFLKS